MTEIIPHKALEQHIAILGKTGSGKTTTAKLAVEQVAKQGARICILDPIKSDWWGLTSSADGKHPGLPFHILGGPHGHVPLNASAGKVVGELAANAMLPLSIIDMALFNPGGHATFFVDFASTLLRKMKGVLYLVIEEAHLFAPKERAGFGAENMAIHWAKMLATAGRSKGIRLIIATQRTQALHNALLGSCDSMIVHRLTAPADQAPVVTWLKANTEKEIREQVAASLSSLPTGTGWLCSGEAQIFRKVAFPRITTYDNTATPTDDAHTGDVVTATPGDRETLRALLGEMVAQAEAEDPKLLKAEIARLTKELHTKKAGDLNEAAVADAALALQQIKAARDEGYHQGHNDGFKVGYKAGQEDGWKNARHVFVSKLQEYLAKMEVKLTAEPPPILPKPNGDGVALMSTAHPTGTSSVKNRRISPSALERVEIELPPGSVIKVSPIVRKILNAIHGAYPVSLSFAAAAARAGASRRSSAYGDYEKQVLASGEVNMIGGRLQSAPGFASPVVSAGDPVETWVGRLPPSYGRMLRAIAENDGVSRDGVGDLAEVSLSSSGLDAGLKELVALALVEKRGALYFPSEGLR